MTPRRGRDPEAPAPEVVEGPAPDDAPAAGKPSSSTFLEALGAIGPPVTVATALLLYFGWARADAQAEAMGLDVSVFSYTAQDYILRSVNALFLPLIVILVAALAWSALDRMLRRRLAKSPRGVSRIGVIVAVAGLLGVLTSAALLVFSPSSVQIAGPYLAAVSIMIAAWGLSLVRAAKARQDSGRRESRALAHALVFVLVTLFLFWGTADFAQALGRRLAADYEVTVNSLPRASLYSSGRLVLGVTGIDERRVDSPTGALYRYSGLRLLVLSGDRYFFLHDGWTLESGTVVVMKDNGSVRFEFRN